MNGNDVTVISTEMANFKNMADVEESVSSDGVSDAWMKLFDSDYARVIFYDVSDEYATGTDILCCYSLTSLVTPDKGDCIGLYHIGWRNEPDYVTSQKVTDAFHSHKDENQMCNIFKAETLPKDDGEFYQFCYFSKGEIRGASTPFRFRDSFHSNNDECVALENGGEDFLLVYSKHAALKRKLFESEQYNKVLQKNNEELENNIKERQALFKVEIQCITDKYEASLSDNDDIKRNLETLQNDFEKHKDLLTESKHKIAELECELKAQTDNNKEYEALMKSLMSGKEQLAEKLEIIIQERNSLQLYVEDLREKLQLSRARNEVQKLTEDDQNLMVMTLRARYLELDLHKKKAEYSKLENLFKEKEEERLFLQVQLEDTKAMFLAQEDTKSLMLKELAAHKEFRNQITSLLESAKSENFSLKKKLKELKQDKSQVTTLLDNTKSENVALKKKLDEIRNEIERNDRKMDSLSSKNQEKHFGVSVLGMAEMIHEHIKAQTKQEVALSSRIDELELRLLAGAKEFERQYLQMTKLKKHIKKLERQKKNRSSKTSSMKESSPSCSCIENISNDENSQEQCAQNKNFFHIIRIKGANRCNDSDTGECISQSLSNTSSPGPLKIGVVSESGVKINSAQELKSPQVNVKDKNLTCESLKLHSHQQNIQVPLIPAPNAVSDCKVFVQGSDLLSHSDDAESILPVLPPPLTPEISHWPDSSAINVGAQSKSKTSCDQHFNVPFHDFTEIKKLTCTDKVFSLEESVSNIFEVPCPICESKFPVVADDNTFLLAHLKESHGQEPCPLCGQLFDTSLPKEYFQFHVEDHFHGENLPNYENENVQNVNLHNRS